MKLLLWTGIWLLMALGASNRGDERIRWKADQTLRWSDYRGEVPADLPYDAVTCSAISYGYRAVKRDGKLKLHFEVYASFFPFDSWLRPGKGSEALLQHERLHFHITELGARKLRQHLEAFNYSENFKYEVDSIYQAIKAENLELQHLYDRETRHSSNATAQTLWNKWVEKELLQSSIPN